MTESIDNAYCWRITRIAESFGFDRGTVRRKLRAAGVAPATSDGRYRLAEVGPALYRTERHEQGPDQMTPQERKAFFEGENARLALERKSSFLVRAEDRDRELKRLTGVLLSGLDQLPTTLAPVLDADAMSYVHERTAAMREQVQSYE